MKNIEELKAREAEILAEREALFEKKRPIDEKLRTTYEDLRQLRNDIAKMRLEQGVDLAFLLDPANMDTSILIDNKREEAIRELGLYCVGHWSDNNQPAMKVMLTYGEPESLQKTLAAIRTVAPYVLPHEDGMLWFGVFEHRLSEDGIYKLLVKSDLSEAKLMITRYGRDSDVLEGTLEEVIAHIQRYHWYDRDHRKFGGVGDYD